MKFKINGKDCDLTPKIRFYTVKDFTGEDKLLPAVCFEQDGEPFVVATKSFGEFVGMPFATYMDINNCPWITQLIEQGVAIDTGMFHTSGFCTYPVYFFEESFFKKYCDNEDELKRYIEMY